MVEPTAILRAIETILAGVQGLAEIDGMGIRLQIPGFKVSWNEDGVNVESVGPLVLSVAKKEGT